MIGLRHIAKVKMQYENTKGGVKNSKRVFNTALYVMKIEATKYGSSHRTILAVSGTVKTGIEIFSNFEFAHKAVRMTENY